MTAITKKECIHNYYLENNEFKETKHFNFLSLDSSLYEVIRIINGCPLFIEDHYARLKNSVTLSGLHLHIGQDDLARMILKLIYANKIFTGNIKLIIIYQNVSNPVHIGYFINHYYPTEKEYKMGIRVKLFNIERPTPNAKILRNEFLDKINSVKKSSTAFEVILCNHENYITEGSKSNLFFIKNNIIYTAPSYQVLEGITRKKIFNICETGKIKIIEKEILRSQLSDFDGTFITGTSIKVLPVKKIDQINYSVNHPMIRSLISNYEQLMNQYIQNTVQNRLNILQ